MRLLSFGVALPLGLYGLFEWMRRGRCRASDHARSAVVLLLSWAALYALVHIVSWTLIRYRLPIDAVALPFSAYGFTRLRDRVSLARSHATAEVR
jgi:hypothetical protein